jgi:hypothetical protein
MGELCVHRHLKNLVKLICESRTNLITSFCASLGKRTTETFMSHLYIDREREILSLRHEM